MSNELATINNAINPNDFFCTITGTDVNSKKLIASAISAATSLNEINDTPFTLIGIITTSGVRAQSGSPCVNTYLISDEGVSYFTQSEGILKSVKIIRDLFTADELAVGLRVYVKETPLDKGRSIKSLDYVME